MSINNESKMKTVSYTALRQNLSSVLDEIENNQEPCYITRKKHDDIVMITRSDYESLLETLHLLSNPKNARRLKESIAQAKKGKLKEIDL